MNVFSIDGPNGPISGFETGTGPAVVLLAGLGSTGKIWGHLPVVLARRFRVVVVDNRGVGGSRDGRGFTLAGAAEDLTTLFDARDIEAAGLLGASMGGLIALTTALASPDKVTRLVIASSAARLTVHGRRLLELFHDLLLYAPPERAGAALMTLAFAPAFHDAYPGFVDEAAALYGIDEADLPGTLVQLEQLLAGWDLRGQLGALDRPALVLFGGRDPVVAPEDTQELAAALPVVELLRVPDAAHSILAEGGEPILSRVMDFLAEPPPPDDRIT